MRSIHSAFLGMLSVIAATPATGQSLDRYDSAPAASRPGGPAIYPAGVSDPSRANPAGPPLETSIPAPPVPATPPLSVAGAGVSLGTTPMGSPIWSPSGPANATNPQPAIVQTPIYMPAATTPDPEKLTQCSWYTRVDYFHWNERIGSMDFVNEDGALFTLGYSRRIGVERFRAELFGGDVHYDGFGQFSTGLETMQSNTGYLGGRGEYEMVFEPADRQGRVAFLMGMGSRFWIRDLHDGSTDSGDPVAGYQETWWTMYPYLGMETHRSPGGDLDFYSESRIGMTALSYNYASIMDRPLWPKMGVFANLELGLRGPRFFVAGRAEVMTWGESSTVQYAFQPQSLMVTVGGRLGFMF